MWKNFKYGFNSAFKDVKYFLIIMQGLIQGKTVVNFFGGTYIIAGNIVRRIR